MEQVQFDQHPMWDMLTQALALAEELDPAGNPTEIEARQRIAFVASYTRSFQTVAPGYFSEPMLQAVYASWEGVKSQLTNYASNVNVQYLASAIQQADNVVQYLGQWPENTAKGGAAAKANAMFNDYVETATQGLTALAERIKELEGSISSGQAAMQERLTTLDGERLGVVNGLAALEERITADVSRLDAAINTQTAAFTEAQATRDKDFRDEMKTLAKNNRTETNKILEEMQTQRSGAEESLAALTDLRFETEKLAGDTTSSLLARDYGSYSTREFWSGVIAYAFGFLALVGLGWFLIDTLGSITPVQKVSWQYVSLKLGVTITTIGAATVAFQLGYRFIQRSSTNKRVELELRAINTFLADLGDTDEVKRAKLDFVERMFGRAWEGHGESSEDVVNVNAFSKLTDTVLKMIGR